MLASLDPQPEYDVPRIPVDVTEVSDQALMDHLRMQVEWQNFFGTQVVQLEAAADRAKNAYEGARASAMPSGKKTVNEAKSAANADPVVRAAYDNWIVADAQSEAMKMAMANRERCANVLSREVTRRTSREPTQRRVDRNTP